VPTFLHQNWMDFFDRRAGNGSAYRERPWRDRISGERARSEWPNEWRYWVTARQEDKDENVAK